MEIFHQGYFILFLIISLGLILGNVKFKGFSLDISAVIFVALALGHFGFSVPKPFQTIGLLLFIFTVGIQAGPGFFDAFRKYGRQLIILCLILVGSAAILSFGLAAYFDISPELAVGIFNGGLTSTPGLAAAIDATGSPDAAVGYGIAYPFGVIGVILFMQSMPGLSKSKIKSAEDDYKKEQEKSFPKIINNIFRVENPGLFGKNLAELQITKLTHSVISRVKHKDRCFTPNRNTILNEGDLVKGVGTEEDLQKLQMLVGNPTDEAMTFSKEYAVQWVLVTNKKVVNKSLQHLNLSSNYRVTVTRVRRSEIDLSPDPHLRLRFGDKLLLSGSVEAMPLVMRLLGNEKKRLSETNFLPIALGILVGILAGQIEIPFFGLFDFKLGITGGVLAAALILNRIGKTGPILWSMSGNGNQLLRKLGLLLFLAAVGTSAGQTLVSTIEQNGLKLIGIGAAITLIPMLITYFVGRMLKLNILSLAGVITGAMTSTPGLAAVDSKSESSAASVGYASVYPAALVLMIVFSQLIVKLLA